MKIKLDYGKNGLEVNFPEKGVTVVEPRFIPGIPDPDDALRNSLRNPVNSAPLSELPLPIVQVRERA